VTGRRARKPAPTPSGNGLLQIDHAGQQIGLIANPENIIAQARRDTFGAKQAARAAAHAARVKQIGTINRSALLRASAGDRP
jgi:hypothetical protein